MAKNIKKNTLSQRYIPNELNVAVNLFCDVCRFYGLGMLTSVLAQGYVQDI